MFFVGSMSGLFVQCSKWTAAKSKTERQLMLTWRRLTPTWPAALLYCRRCSYNNICTPHAYIHIIFWLVLPADSCWLDIRYNAQQRRRFSILTTIIRIRARKCFSQVYTHSYRDTAAHTAKNTQWKHFRGIFAWIKFQIIQLLCVSRRV